MGLMTRDILATPNTLYGVLTCLLGPQINEEYLSDKVDQGYGRSESWKGWMVHCGYIWTNWCTMRDGGNCVQSHTKGTIVSVATTTITIKSEFAKSKGAPILYFR